MVLIRFSGNPVDRTQITEYRADCATMRDVYASLPVKVDGTEPYVRSYRGDERVGLDDVLDEDDAVLVAIEPGEPGSAAAGYLFFAQLAIGVGGLIASAALFKKPKESKDRDDESSPTYNFTGITQTRTHHQPIEVGCGEWRSGGTVIGEYLTSSYAPVTSTFYQLISFGHGPFESIAGLTEDTPPDVFIDGAMLGANVLINDNPAENYDDVRVQVRMGTPDQEPLYGFEKLIEVQDVGPFELSSEETTLANNQTFPTTWNPLDWQTPTNDPHWELYGRSFDITEAVDSVALRLTAGSGYYSSDAGGNLAASRFNYAVRYQELDGSDNPITTGGPNSDGWYREQPDSDGSAPVFAQQGSFDYEVNVPLYDPQVVDAFATSSNSFSFDIQTTAQNASAPAVAGVATVGAPYPQTGLSVSMFAKMPHIGGTVSVFLCGADSVGGVGGWTFALEAEPHPINAGEDQLFLSLTIYTALGTPLISRRRVAKRQGGFPAVWRQYGFTVGINGFTSFHFDGLGEHGFALPEWLTWSGEDVCIGHSKNNPSRSTSGNVGGDIIYDQVRIYNGVVTFSQMLALYQEIDGLSVPTPAQENCLWRLESSPSPNSNVIQHIGDPQWWESMTLAGGGVLVVGGGIIPSTFVLGTRKRMKVRVEIVRTNVDSTNTSTQDTMEWVQIYGITDARLSYPGKALMAISVRASEQLSGRTPTITVIQKGIKSLVDKGAAFSREWSSNPAWLSKEIIENTQWGLPGDYRADNDQLAEMADRCDEVVYDGHDVYQYDGTAIHAVSQNLWYDSGVVDERGVQRGGIEIHIPYRDQTTSFTTNAQLPSQWVPGHFIRLRGWPDDSHASISFDINTPNGSDGSGSGGYEIYEVSLDSSASGITHSPAFHIVRAYFHGRNEVGQVPTFIADGSYQQDGSTTSSLGKIVDPTNGIIPDTAIVEGGEHRFEFNAVFDHARGGWDALQTVAGVARMAPYRSGKLIRFRQSHIDEPAFLVTQSSIIEGSFSVNYSAKSGRLNAFDLLVSDRDDRFNQTSESYVDPNVVNPTDTNVVRREQLDLFGVTSSAEALRHAKYTANVNRLLIRDGSFKIGPSGLSYEVGDVFRIASDLLPFGRGQGGRSLHHEGSAQQILADAADLSLWTRAFASTASLGANSDATGTAEMFAVTDANGVETGYIETESPQIQPGVYCLGMQLQHSSGSQLIRIEMYNSTDFTDGYWVTIDLGTGLVVESKVDGDGEYSITDVGGGFYYVYLWTKHTPASSLSRLRVLVAPAYDGDTATGVTNVGAVSLVQGKFPAFSQTLGYGVCIERSMTIDAAEVCWGMTVGGKMVSASGITNAAGSYSRGQVILFTSGFSDANSVIKDVGRPGQYSFIDTTDGGLLAEIVGVEMGEGLEIAIDWVEYNEAVFDDRSNAIGGGENLVSNDDHGGLTAERAAKRVPDRVSIDGAEDWTSLTVSGSVVTNIRVWWTPVKRDIFLVNEVAIWTRNSDLDQARWNRAGTAQGADGFANIPIADGSVGTTIDVAIQPISGYGARRHVDRCGRASVTIRGRTVLPAAPSAVSVELTGLRSRHSWTPPEGDRGLVVECRRGGWILGQPVFLSGPGARESKASSNWAGSDFQATSLFYRCRTSALGYSPHVEVLDSPVIALDSDAPLVTEQSRAWESFSLSNGWEPPVPSANDPGIGPEFTQHADGSLRYSGGSTETTADAVVWESSESSVVPTSGRAFTEPRRVFIEAYFEATQIAPDSWDPDETFDSYDATRRSAEGPVTLFSSESSTTLRCQITVNETGFSNGWSGWMDYEPGEYSVADVRFRMVATRPSTDFSIALRKLHTRVTSRAGRLDESTPRRRLLEGQIF